MSPGLLDAEIKKHGLGEEEEIPERIGGTWSDEQFSG